MKYFEGRRQKIFQGGPIRINPVLTIKKWKNFWNSGGLREVCENSGGSLASPAPLADDAHSSVARGAGRVRAPPIGLWSMQNRTFLVLLRPIFGEKLKTAPPTGNWVPKLWSTCRDSVWKSVGVSDFGRKSSLNIGEDLFFFFFFGDHLFLGGKNVRITELSEKFRLNFRTNRVILIEEEWKFGSRSFALFSLFQKSPPPPFQILVTRLDGHEYF